MSIEPLGPPLALGAPVAVTAGTPGVGIRNIYADGTVLVVELTDGSTSLIRVPVLDGQGGASTGVNADVQHAIELAVSDRATLDQLYDALAEVATAQHRHVVEDIDTLPERLAAMDEVLGHLDGAEVATSQQVADAIAALQISDYLKIADAADTYAAKSHTHTTADVAGLGAFVDSRVQAASDLSTYAKIAYVDQKVADLGISQYLKKAEADLAYAAKVDVWTPPAGKTTGDVLTWDGTKYVAQPVTGALTKATADTLYHPKLANGTANGQVLAWNGSAYAPVAPADTSKLIPKSAFSQKNSLLVGDGSGTYRELPPYAGTEAVFLGATAADGPFWGYPSRTEVFGLGGVVAVKSGGGRAYTSGKITGIHASVGTAGAVTVEVVVDGAVKHSLSIPAGQNASSLTSLATPVPAGSWIGVNVTSADGVAADLVVRVEVG